jgi:hypothetical protein
MDRAGFDPRYSPEFQRGFDASRHGGHSAAETREGLGSVPEPVAPVPQPIVRRVPPVPTEAQTASESSATAWVNDMFLPADVPAPEQPGGESDQHPVAPVAPASPWRNPYLIVLAVVGVVLVASGIGAFRWAVKQVFGGAVYESGGTEADVQEAMLAAQLAWGLSPLLALAGVLTLLGVFFFAAWRWRPRHPFVDDESDAASTRA